MQPSQPQYALQNAVPLSMEPQNYVDLASQLCDERAADAFHNVMFLILQKLTQN
jgi:hypothetical protein